MSCVWKKFTVIIILPMLLFSQTETTMIIETTNIELLLFFHVLGDLSPKSFACLCLLVFKNINWCGNHIWIFQGFLKPLPK